MITANVNFLSRSADIDLSEPPAEVQKQLQRIGVLTVPSLIMLDNARTVKINLTADDMTGENILKIIDRNKDTLGAVNKLCGYVRRMDYRDDAAFSEKLENGEYSTLDEALKAAEKLKEQRRIKNKRQDMGR